MSHQTTHDLKSLYSFLQQGPVEPMQVDVQPEGNDGQEDLVYTIDNPSLVSTLIQNFSLSHCENDVMSLQILE